MTRSQMRARAILLVAGLTLATSGASATVAGASPPVTPVNQSVGACNMTNPNAAFGMFTIAPNAPNPISQGFSHGWNGGMITAINNTNPNDLGFCG